MNGAGENLPEIHYKSMQLASAGTIAYAYIRHINNKYNII